MKLIRFFLVFALLLAFAQAGAAYHYERQSYSYGGMHQYRGLLTNQNPYYARYGNGNIGGYNNLRTELDYAYYRTPSLFDSVRSVNYRRYTRGFGDNYFRIYHSGGRTGRIRSFLS